MTKRIDIIKDVVRGMGGTIEEFLPGRGFLYVIVSGKRILMESNLSITRQCFVSEKLTSCKDITSKLLLDNNLPTPKTEFFYNKDYNKIEASEKLDSFHYPIILKNATGSKSVGMFPGVEDLKSATKILKKQLPIYRSMVAQEMVFGREYRILILGEKIIGALEMIHPHIIGDGISSIRKIIRQKQCTTERRTKFDTSFLQTLKKQGVSLRTVLVKDRIVYFKRNSCLAEGGETKNITDIVHVGVKDLCVLASKVVGRYLVGIDIMCDDITKKPTKKNFSILEINGKPDLYIHYNPTHGESQDVLREVIQFLIKEKPPVLVAVK